MGNWYDNAKNRNRENGVIRCNGVQMAKRAQNRNKWQKGCGGADRRDTIHVIGLRELITNTSTFLAHHALQQSQLLLCAWWLWPVHHYLHVQDGLLLLGQQHGHVCMSLCHC